MQIPPRLRQVLITALIVVVVLALAGATYQGVATALERRRYPHPGQLVDVGGHQLHIHCTGEGSPTVILEAPAAGFSASWALVQPQVAATTRACSYDRAGLGWSEAGDGGFEPGRVPEELHVLLDAAGVQGPYVAAGYLLGASYARLFASRYPDEVAAVLLVDPAGPARIDASAAATWPWLARAGLLRASGAFSDAAAGLPAPAEGAMKSFLNRPDHLTRAGMEITRWSEVVRLAQDAPLRVKAAIVDTAGPRLDDEEMATPSAISLNDPQTARRVSAAIAAAVRAVRTP